MGVTNLQIIFDNPTAVFRPGETITGRVVIVANSFKRFKKIQLKFKGEGRVHWTERESRTNSKNETENYNVNYDASEEYLNYTIILQGNEDNTFELEGEHVYPFNVSLPIQLPSTFKGEYGYVQYKTIVVLDIPWSIKKSKEITFEIKSPLNLNDELSLAEPKIQEKEKYFCCCCCKSGPMTMVVFVPYSGFVPGQSIPVTIEVDNNTNVDIDSIKIRLDRTLKFKSKSPWTKTKHKAFKIVNKYLIGVKKYTSKTWTEKIMIPNSLMVTNLKHCGIITDSYFLNVEAYVNGGHINGIASIEITLGDVPLSIARNAPQYGHSFQPLYQGNNVSNELFLKNNLPASIGFIDSSSPIPGRAHQVVVSRDQQWALPMTACSLDPEHWQTSTRKNSSTTHSPVNHDQPPPYQLSDPKITPIAAIQLFDNDEQIESSPSNST